MQVFDYAGDDPAAPPAAEVSLLPFKERFLPRDHPDLSAMAHASARLRRAGFDETNVGHGLTPPFSSRRGSTRTCGTTVNILLACAWVPRRGDIPHVD